MADTLPPETYIREALRRIRALQRAGVSDMREIAERLNADGFTSRKGRAWSGARVRKFLSSPGAQKYI